MKHLTKKKTLNRILLRVIFLPLIFAALLFATASIVVKTMFDQQNLEAIVTDQLQSFFKRPVQIESARFSLTGEIKITRLRVLEPGPQTMNFITAEYILATYRLAPLLKHNVVLDSVVLVSPKIELIKQSSGVWNFSDILAAYRLPSTGKNRLNKIDAAEIRDGIVNVRGADATLGYSFENVSFNLKDFKPETDSPFDLAMFVKRKAPAGDMQGRLYAEGLMNLHGFKMDLAEIKDLSMTVSLQDKSFKAQGNLKNFRRPEIRVTARAEGLTDRDLEPLLKTRHSFALPPSVWTLAANTRADKTVDFSLRGNPPALRAEGTIKFSSGAAAYDFSVLTPPFNLAELKRTFPEIPLAGAAGIVQGRINANNKTGKFTLSKLIFTSDQAGFQYRNLRFDDLTLSALFTKSFKDNYLNVKNGRMTMAGFRLTRLNVNTRLSGDKITGDYSALWGGNPMRGSLAIREPLTDRKIAEFTGYSKRLDIKEGRDFLLELKKVRVSEKRRSNYEAGLAWIRTVKNSIPAGFAGFRLLYKADFLKHEYFDARDFHISADLRDITGRMEKLKGSISIKSGGGTFYDVQKTSEQDRIYYIFSLPVLTMYRLNRMGALKFGYKLNDVAFNSIGGAYTLGSGIITIRNFYMAGKDFSIYTTGSLDLANENLKLKVYTISDKYYSMGSLPETLTDASGKPALAFTIEGKMNKPDINMMSPRDAGRIIGEAIKKGISMDTSGLDQFKEKQ